MISTLWQRLRSRHKQVLQEVLETQQEMARENPRPPLPVLRNRPNTLLTAITFSVLVILVGVICWIFLRGSQ